MGQCPAADALKRTSEGYGGLSWPAARHPAINSIRFRPAPNTKPKPNLLGAGFDGKYRSAYCPGELSDRDSRALGRIRDASDMQGFEVVTESVCIASLSGKEPINDPCL
jgi:hypothetical protein